MNTLSAPVLLIASGDASSTQLDRTIPAIGLAAAIDSLLVANPNALYAASASDALSGNGSHSALFGLLSGLPLGDIDAKLTVRILDVQLPSAPGAPGLVSFGVVTELPGVDNRVAQTDPPDVLVTAINVAYDTSLPPAESLGGSARSGEIAHAITTVTVRTDESAASSGSPDVTVIATASVGSDLVSALSEVTVLPLNVGGLTYWNSQQSLNVLVEGSTASSNVNTPAVTLVSWVDEYATHSLAAFNLVNKIATDYESPPPTDDGTVTTSAPPVFDRGQFDAEVDKLRDDLKKQEERDKLIQKFLTVLKDPALRESLGKALGLDPANLTDDAIQRRLNDLLTDPGDVDLGKWAGSHAGIWTPSVGKQFKDDAIWKKPVDGGKRQDVDKDNDPNLPGIQPKPGGVFNEKDDQGLKGYDPKESPDPTRDSTTKDGTHVGYGQDGPNDSGIIVWVTPGEAFIEGIYTDADGTRHRFSIGIDRKTGNLNGSGKWLVTPLP